MIKGERGLGILGPLSDWPLVLYWSGPAQVSFLHRGALLSCRGRQTTNFQDFQDPSV